MHRPHAQLCVPKGVGDDRGLFLVIDGFIAFVTELDGALGACSSPLGEHLDLEAEHEALVDLKAGLLQVDW